MFHVPIVSGFPSMVSVSRQFVFSREACHPITGCSVKALLTASHLADRLPACFAFKAPDSHWDISGCQVTAHGSLRCTCMSFLYEHTLQIPVLQMQTQWQCAWQFELVLVTAWNSEKWRVLHRSVYIYFFFEGWWPDYVSFVITPFVTPASAFVT